MRGDVGAYGSHVAVESTTGHNDVGRQSQPLGPFGRELAYGLSAVSVFSKSRSRKPASNGSRVVRNFSSGRPPQLSCHMAYAASATTADNVAAVFHAGDKGGQPLAIFDDEIALTRTCGSSLRICRALAQNHSEE